MSGSILDRSYAELYDFKYSVRVWEDIEAEEIVS